MGGGRRATLRETAAQTVRDIRVAAATRFDVTIQEGRVSSYRVRLDISFKYERLASWERAPHPPDRLVELIAGAS